MLRGSLSEFPLLNVLQMLTNSGASGKLHVSHLRGGDLWLQGGEVVHASALLREGDDALDLLSSVGGGDFTFEPGQAAPKQSVDTRRTALLRQLSVSSDAWQELLRLFPHWDRPLTFTSRWTDQQPVTRAQFRTLNLVGRVPLGDLVAQSDLSPRATLEVLRPFVQSGLVDSGAQL
ncbi:DUF4388 domain-containing protein [Deinococcus detaillensis]|uniref:DUF4388 domain-containing protein n=1 Tax=Deinococcus detaillensis TaxID=2592048 RepID=A0A553V4D4_9DEIO|nr:DUF4388 domain-containing protein [Deinococcus detaillensis]TSA87319.1 DUF4388 domain-containing protein [Deinococcus detaillensis]